MTLTTFLDLASPTTLASLIADVQALGKGAPAAALRLERDAQRALVCLCGVHEAARLVDTAGNPGDVVDLAAADLDLFADCLDTVDLRGEP